MVNKKYKLTNEIDQEHKQVSTEHVDHENLHTFEIDDLKKLILKASADLTEADNKRREEFKVSFKSYILCFYKFNHTHKYI